MVALKRGTHWILFILVTVLGESAALSSGDILLRTWYAVAATSALVLLFDRSQGQWSSFLVLAIQSVFALGLSSHAPMEFLVWACLAATVATSICIFTQFRIHSILVVCLAAGLTGLFLLIELSLAELIIKDAIFLLVVGAVALMALLPLVVMLMPAFRPREVWALLNVQQFLVRLGFLVWCFSGAGKPEQGEIVTVVSWSLLGLSLLTLVLVNLKINQLSWSLVTMSFFSLAIFSAALIATPATFTWLLGLTALAGITGLTPVRSGTHRGDAGLAFLENGGAGGLAISVLLLVFIKAKQSTGGSSAALWILLALSFASFVWTQFSLEDLWGKSEKGEVARAWVLGRWTLQAVGTILVLLDLVRLVVLP